MIDFNDAPRQAQTRFEDAEARRDRIAAGLKRSARDFIRFLYPKAAFTGHDARIGDIYGQDGESMSIEFAGERAGLWTDHATGEGGDLLTLWALAHNLDPNRDFARVLTECENWLGGAPPVYASQRHDSIASQPRKAQQPKTLERIYVYRDRDGKPTGVEQRRYTKADGSKTFVPFVNDSPGMLPSSRPLYGMEHWHNQSTIVFVEGEKCADALNAIGIPSASAIGGANTTLEKTDWSPLAGKEVILWPDHDYPRPSDGLQPGYDFMRRVGAWLRALGCTVRELRPPQDKPDKWDAYDAIEEGFDVVAFLRPPAVPEHGLSGFWLDELAYAYEPELVEGLIPANGVGVIYGPSSAGKSFIAVDWSIRLASGVRILDRWTEGAGVLYFAAEGQAGLRKRLVAARAEHGLDGVELPFNYLPALLDLSRAETGDVERLCQYAEEVSAEMAQRGRALKVIVVDTLAASAPSADENAQKDMGPVMLAFHRMALRLGAVVLLVAHTGKDVTRGLRGWSGIRANADFAIECRVEKDEETGETTRRSVWFEKSKDGPDGFTLTDYHLRQRIVGLKHSGEPDTTCWVEYGAPEPAAPAGKKAQEVYSGAYLQIIHILRDEAKTTGEVANELRLERSNVGKKLRTLQEDGVVFSRDDGPRKIWVLCNDVLPTSVEQKQ